MGLRALRGSRLEIRYYIEGFMILKARRRGVTSSNMVVPMLRLVWEGGLHLHKWGSRAYTELLGHGSSLAKNPHRDPSPSLDETGMHTTRVPSCDASYLAALVS